MTTTMPDEMNGSPQSLKTGKVLKSFLESRDWSQEEGARKAGVGLGFLSRLIRGQRFLESSVADILAAAWGLDEKEIEALRAVVTKVPLGEKTVHPRSSCLA
jgi:transcriptional regulator with XRE-family HTH domain